MVPKLSNEDELTSINRHKEEIVLAVPEKLLKDKMKQTPYL